MVKLLPIVNINRFEKPICLLVELNHFGERTCRRALFKLNQPPSG